MRKDITKFLRRGTVCLVLAFIFVLLFTALVFLQPQIPDRIVLPCSVGVAALAETVLIIYCVKYMQLHKSFRILKSLGLEHYLDDINLFMPSFEHSKVCCGKHACYAQKPHTIIIYEQVAWIYPSTQEPGYYVFRLKNGKSVSIKIFESELFRLINQFIAPHNPDLLDGFSPENKKLYLQRNPQARAKKSRSTGILGIALLALSVFLTGMGIRNGHIEWPGIVLLVVLVSVGIYLLIKSRSKKQPTSLNLRARITKSPVFNMICKVSTVGGVVCTIGVLIGGPLRIEILLAPCLIGYLVFIVPFFASIFLGCGFFAPKAKPSMILPQQPLEDESYILQTLHTTMNDNNSTLYLFRHYIADPLRWESILQMVDYLLKADIVNFLVRVVDGNQETDITASFRANGNRCASTPELQKEHQQLILIGDSRCADQRIRLNWTNQANMIDMDLALDSQTLSVRYIETLLRRSFKTADALKLGEPSAGLAPVVVKEQRIHIYSFELIKWCRQNATQRYELTGVIPLTERTPVITLFDDGEKVREYCLQTKGDEDFTGKYFHYSVRLTLPDLPMLPIAQIDGFISDTPEKREFTQDDIGYRMEGYYLSFLGKPAEEAYATMRGADLPAKGLRYPGYTTPSNIRLIGICPECKKSFCFHSFAFYMGQNDVAYSDDGLYCCSIADCNINPDTWSYEEDGKTFRYYNSFRCPHCGEAYIDYTNHHDRKVFGVSGCVHLGDQHFNAK